MPSSDTFGSRKASSTAKSPIPKSASCRSGRNRTAAGSCWRVRLGGCRRQHSTALVGKPAYGNDLRLKGRAAVARLAVVRGGGVRAAGDSLGDRTQCHASERPGAAVNAGCQKSPPVLE